MKFTDYNIAKEDGFPCIPMKEVRISNLKSSTTATEILIFCTASASVEC